VCTYGRAGNPSRGTIAKKHKKDGVWPRRIGLAAKGVLGFTLGALERALGAKVAHRHCLLYVSHEDPDYTSGRLLAALEGTAWEKRIVLGVKGADMQARFIEESCPRGTHVIIADDNIRNFVAGNASWDDGGNRFLTSETRELGGLIVRAGKLMQQTGAKLWSVNPSCNHYILHQRLRDIHAKMKKKDLRFEQCDYSTRLGLVYGAFFGMEVLHDPSRYTRYGQVKDDLERTLRYWHLDTAILRFQVYSVVKSHKPGAFARTKGGISASSCLETHRNEAHEALKKMLVEFASSYARLPQESELAPCGLIFQSQAAHENAKKKKKMGLASKPAGHGTWIHSVVAARHKDREEQLKGSCRIQMEIKKARRVWGSCVLQRPRVWTQSVMTAMHKEQEKGSCLIQLDSKKLRRVWRCGVLH